MTTPDTVSPPDEPESIEQIDASAAGVIAGRDRTRLRHRTVRGIAWNAAAGLSGQLTSFVVAIVLSHLLVPRQFGLVGMVAIFTNFLNTISNFGFSQALVQRRELTREHLLAGFWATTAMQFVVAAVFIAGAPLIADFYHQPQLRLVSITMGVTIAIGMNAVPGAILERDMAYRKLATVEFTAGLVKNLSAIVMAAVGFGVWSLVLSPMISTALATVLLFAIVRWLPIGRPTWKAFRDLWKVGGGTTGAQAIGYWSAVGDNLLVGKFIGAAGLGLYNRAYNLMLAPLALGTQAVARVMISALSAIQDDLPRVRRGYLQAMGVIALVVFPISIGLALCADDFVRAVLGNRWLPSVGPLRILGALGAVQAITATNWWIYQSTGRTDVQFRRTVINTTVIVTGFAVAVQFGITAVAASFAAANVILLYWNLTIPGRLIEMRLSDVWRQIRLTVLATLVMSAAVLLVGLAMPGVAPGWRLGARIAAGAVAYLAMLALTRPEALSNLLGMLPGRLRITRMQGAAR